jgi:SAM-dependent methyltransferase
MNDSKRTHWEEIYKTKEPNELSWTQESPNISLNFIQSFGLSKKAKIIDIGAGNSNLAEYLLAEGFENITVLDISSTAIEKAKERLGAKAKKINWVVGDVTQFLPETTYDLWHDRATFHFLTTAKQVSAYLKTARNAVTGYLTIGTFSDKGPEKCSGLPVRQYTETQLTEVLQNGFQKIRCITEDHITPFNTKQHFLFCSFKRNRN